MVRSRLPLVAVLLLASGLVLSVLVVHFDENDGAVYVVIARHLARDGTPFRLRYLSETFPSFHEHPPLWIWIQAAALRLDPRFPPGLLGALCAVGTVALAFWLGRDLLGPRAAFLGCTLLAATDSFFRWSPTGKLDPPLVLAFTASVALLVRAEGRPGMLALGGLAAGLGALVKGAPALGAPVAAALLLLAAGRTADLRSPRAWALVALGALLPPALFLGWDRAVLGGEWWRGYVQDQLLASLVGRRADARGHLYLARSVLGRGIPAVPLAAVALVRPRGARLGLLLWAALVVGAFSAASRSYWWYALPAFVPLSLLGGAGLDDLLRWLRLERAEGALVRAVAVAGLLLLGALPFRARVGAPCRFGDLADRARALAPPGTSLGMVADPADWPAQAVLAEHTGRDVLVRERLADLPPRVEVALQEGPPGPLEAGWEALGVVPRGTRGPVRLVRRLRP